MIPYLPSTALYAEWLRHRISGLDDAGSWCRACSGTAPRGFARTTVAGGGSQPPLVLSIPLEGGAATVKKAEPEDWNISLHGRWPAIHLGALNAAYSSSPYFPHLIPLVEPVIKNVKEGDNLYDFNLSLHNNITDFLAIDNILPFLQRNCIDASGNHFIFPECWKYKSQSAATFLDMSFLHYIFQQGRSAIFTLMALISMMVIFVMPAQAVAEAASVPEIQVKAYEGFQHFVDEYGDTVRMTYIREIVVYPPMKFKNKKEEDYYWKTVRDVRKTLPYAKLCYSTLCETYEYIQTIPDPKKREEHLKRLEKDIFERYKPVVKNMTKGQGKILLKLINRETDQSSYNIVKAFLGSFRAGFWQTFGKFFGMNMKAGFNPKKNKEDATIDRIATLIEQGAL